MSGINSVTLVGRLTKDIDLRKTKDGTSYTRFTVAIDRRFKKDETDFIDCIAWRQSADFLYAYARKGNLVGLTGSIQTGSYTDKDGRKVYTTDIVTDSVQLLEKKTSSDTQATQRPDPVEPEVPGYEDSVVNFGSDDLPF